MAIQTGWLRGARGKFMGATLYYSQGRTIQREIVTPKNPQTDAQMQQRLNMAVNSKFYQDAQQNRFAVAFANKKSNQSNFNAFSSANLKELGTLIYPTKDQINDPAFCAYFPWICSKGNLQGIEVAETDDQMEAIGALIFITSPEGVAYETWEEVIAGNPTLNLQYGDIITVTAVLNDMTCPEGNIVIGNRAPVWVTRQFIIGADLAGGTLSEYFALNGFDSFSTLADNNRSAPMIDLSDVYSPGTTLYFGPDDDAENKTAMMCCVTRSRFENGKTQVSNSSFWCDDEAQKIYTRLSTDVQLQEAIASYKAGARSSAPTEVLQGSIAVDPAYITELKYTTAAGNLGTRHSFPTTLASTKSYNDPDHANSSLNQLLVTLEGTASVVTSDFTLEDASGKLILGVGVVKMSDGTYRATLRVRGADADLTTALPYSVKFKGTTFVTASLAKKA